MSVGINREIRRITTIHGETLKVGDEVIYSPCVVDGYKFNERIGEVSQHLSRDNLVIGRIYTIHYIARGSIVLSDGGHGLNYNPMDFILKNPIVSVPQFNIDNII